MISEIVKILNSMKKKKYIKEWALGGGVAAKYYVNPPITKDIDFFVTIDDKSIMFMQPIYAYMIEQGAEFKGHLFKYKGITLDIIPVMNELVKEAVNKSEEVVFDNVKLNIISADYLAAIALQVGRNKDIDRVKRLFNARLITVQFMNLIEKYKLQINKLN
jgi:hypothetical protein